MILDLLFKVFVVKSQCYEFFLILCQLEFQVFEVNLERPYVGKLEFLRAVSLNHLLLVSDLPLQLRDFLRHVGHFRCNLVWLFTDDLVHVDLGTDALRFLSEMEGLK